MGQRLSLDADVRFVPGVGPTRADEFAVLGIRTVGDLIEHFPFRHETIPKSVGIGELALDETATIVGEIGRVRLRGSVGRRVVTATVVDGTGRCTCRWFHSQYLLEKLHVGQVVRLTGRIELFQENAAMTNPSWEIIDENEDPLAGDVERFVPVYPATGQLPSKRIAGIIAGLLSEVAPQVAEFLPDELREKRKLPLRRTALLRFHQPLQPEDVNVSRRRFAYEEFLLCLLAVQLSRCRRRGIDAKPIRVSEEIDRRIRRRFPFTLTAGQDRAAGEIRADLARTTPMNRMLMADVGAGKTVVALYACLAAIAGRMQAIILAPTEVLASQHAGKVDKYLKDSRVRVEFLSGATTKGKRRDLLTRLASGEVDLLIGTHAVLERDVRFRDLGVVVIDEQHKFGVAQRAALRQKGTAPHVLVLSATPIPRTLAMTVFGDLDVSTIDGAPPNRQPIATRLVTPDLEGEAWRFVQQRLAAHEQAYIVYPLVEDSEALPLKSARTEVERLSRGHLKGFALGLLHGKMKSAEKQEVMARFRSGEIQVLVSTTVIEVGVDVPTATVMIVQHAERYGLSQLHQLRGRIGRGSKKSYCLLFAEPSGETATERLNILCETTDGFRIAEEDLRIRGPGELLGTRQHGLPEFKVANLVGDLDLLTQARDDAVVVLKDDPKLLDARHAALRRELMRRYGSVMGLADVA
ncbi:MAG: ATP-dependent DNA helicase RecG [Planctomycetes bacterium]|nr:ATP-dependent DNA helicase RecG [Planctomycetota bacterium]